LCVFFLTRKADAAYCRRKRKCGVCRIILAWSLLIHTSVRRQRSAVGNPSGYSLRPKQIRWAPRLAGFSPESRQSSERSPFPPTSRHYPRRPDQPHPVDGQPSFPREGCPIFFALRLNHPAIIGEPSPVRGRVSIGEPSPVRGRVTARRAVCVDWRAEPRKGPGDCTPRRACRLASRAP
jgi:hypothetical protein